MTLDFVEPLSCCSMSKACFYSLKEGDVVFYRANHGVIKLRNVPGRVSYIEPRRPGGSSIITLVIPAPIGLTKGMITIDKLEFNSDDVGLGFAYVWYSELQPFYLRNGHRRS